jgi:hypothetical protein
MQSALQNGGRPDKKPIVVGEGFFLGQARNIIMP